ncbi:hypothetical protein pipiens_004808 [Culex pipiens pipiens]|uniref:CDT1 Geminin-binding domain-containing protein n=1 Tax=Culex pipiens pipiens TaxID=38569 RepID=A0ABD1CEN8_CULPP
MLDTSTSSTLAGRECEGDGGRESVEGIGSRRGRGIYDESERLRAGSAGHGSSGGSVKVTEGESRWKALGAGEDEESTTSPNDYGPEVQDTDRRPTKVPAYQRFQTLADSGRPALQLLFKCIDTVCAMFHNRKKQITFRKLKPAVQRMARKNFYENRLAQNNTFNRLLLAKEKDAHETFLLALDLPMRIAKEKSTRWIPEFDLESCRTLPKCHFPCLRTWSDSLRPRTEDCPPRVRRRRHYTRGFNKYTRNWEDEEVYSKSNNVNKHTRPRKSLPRPEEFPELGGGVGGMNNSNNSSGSVGKPRSSQNMRRTSRQSR